MSDPFLALHLRVLGGDREAVELLAAALVGPLSRRLQRQFPRTEPDLIAEAVHDALVVYQEDPHVFDASGVPLAAFLYGLAGRVLWVKLRAADSVLCGKGTRRIFSRRMRAWRLMTRRPEPMPQRCGRRCPGSAARRNSRRCWRISTTATST